MKRASYSIPEIWVYEVDVEQGFTISSSDDFSGITPNDYEDDQAWLPY